LGKVYIGVTAVDGLKLWGVGGKKVALFGSYGWGDGQWMRDWAERTTKTGANLYDDGLMVNGFPDADAKVQCTAFGEGFGAY